MTEMNEEFQDVLDARAAEIAALPDSAVSERERKRRIGEQFAEAFANHDHGPASARAAGQEFADLLADDDDTTTV